jgi:cardiolipin synthase A/B
MPSKERSWLRRRIPTETLLKRVARRKKRRRLGHLERIDRFRSLLRAWWLWGLGAALLLEQGYWWAAAPVGFFAYLLFHSAPSRHAAVYALETDLDPASAEFRKTMAGATGMPWMEGNRVVVFNNGDEFFPAMLEAIAGARESITMEQYIFWDGEVGRRFAEAFAEKAREGVAVKLLVDAVGSSTLGREIERILEASGCQLAYFQPVKWYTLNRANHRTHRKALILDGAAAFTGGAGLADQWLGQARNVSEWRDMQVLVEGPAVQAQQSGFAQNWLVTTGEVLAGPEYFPVIARAGEVAVQTVLSSPHIGTGAAGTMAAIALQCARQYVRVANPYFIPDFRYLEMVREACARGVKIELLVAGEHNDAWWARQNSLRLYGKLLEAGVEIYEYLPTMLHQKVMVVDGAWASVGSANFDNRSLALNEESNVCFYDGELIRRLEDDFEADLRRAEKIQGGEWGQRGLFQRSKEEFAALIEDQV